MPGSDTDDIAIRKEAVGVLKEDSQRIQDIFKVEIACGFLSDDGTQWLEIGGKKPNRKEAKDYIKALCNPAEKIDMEYSAELYPLLSNPSVHRKLEKQSNAAIRFPSKGLLSILGSDTLSVTLALSSVEELINKYLNQETSQAAAQMSPTTNLSSQRLDDELRRLSTENQSILIEDDYYSANDAVKRTILNWMKDDSILEHDEADAEETQKQIKQQVGSSHVSGMSAFNSPRTSYSNNNGEFNSNLKTTPLRTSGVNAHGSGVQTISPARKGSSCDLELIPPENFVATKRVSSNSTASSVPTATAVPLPLPNLSNSASSIENTPLPLFGYNGSNSPVSMQEIKSKDYLFAMGLQYNFSDEDIETVFERHSSQLTINDFLKYALNIKSERQRAKEVQSLDGAKEPGLIDLTKQSPLSKFAKSQDCAFSVSAQPSTSQKQNEKRGEDYLLALGLEHNYEEEDIQAVFEKQGTLLTVTEFLEFAFQARSDRERKKITSESSVMPKFPKAPSAEEMASNKSLQPEILKNKKHMDKYFSQLSKDFNEEQHCDVDELKMRNFERQRLLRQAREKAGKEEEVMDQENWDEGMDVGFKEVENKKRKHKNTDKTSEQRKSRWSPIDEKFTVDKFQDKGKSSKHTGKGTGFKKHSASSKAAKNRFSPIDNNNQSSKPGPSFNWSPNDDKTSFSDLCISKSSKDTNFIQAFPGQSNPFTHENNKAGMDTYQTPPMQIMPTKPYTRDRSNRSPSPKGAAAKNRNFSRSPQNLPNRSSPRNAPDTTAGMPAPTIALRSNLRYVVIDGSNVAFHHGNHHVFSCKGIEIVINYFLKRGHTEVTAFVPQWRTRTVQNTPMEDQHLLEELRKKGYLVYTPARKIGGKNIRTHDDNFVLRLAVETDGIVVTNDNFRDHYEDKPEWRDVIVNKLLMYSFVGDFFMPPEDPLGPGGPTMDEFLRKDTDLSARREIFKDRSHSGSPKNTRHRFPDANRQKYHHQQPLSQPQVTVSTRHPHPQQAWQQQQPAKGNQQHWQHAGPRGRGENQGNSSNGSHMAVGGGGQLQQQGGKNLTWQQQELLSNKGGQKQAQQQGNRQQQNRREAGQGGGQSVNTGPSLRTEEQTTTLFKELTGVFPNELVKIQRILQNHPRECDIEKLSIHLLDIMDET